MESYPRPAARPVITLRFERFSSFVEEYASNLSLGGMFISARKIRPVGQVVGLEVELGDGFRLIEGVGKVVWVRSRAAGSDRPAGMALRFQALDEQGRELVLKILEEQVKSGGEPFDIDNVPVDAETEATAPATPEPVPEAPAVDTVGADETPPELDFRAPWGPELPEIPHEFLEEPEPTDGGTMVEPTLPAEKPAGPETETLAADAGTPAEDGCPVLPSEEAAGPPPPLPPLPRFNLADPPSAPAPASPLAELDQAAEPAAERHGLADAETEPRQAEFETETAGEIAAVNPAMPEPPRLADKEATLLAAFRPPEPETAASNAGSTPHLPPQSTPAQEVVPSYSSQESPEAKPDPPSAAPANFEAAAATREAILDYEEDLFRDEAPGSPPMAARIRSLLASGARLLTVLLLLAAVAGGLYYRESLARMAGFGGPSPAEQPTATAPAEEPSVEPGTGGETLAPDADPEERRPSPKPQDGAPDPPPESVGQGAAGIAAEAPSPILQADDGTETAAAHRVETISWRTTAAGTEVTLELDGHLGDRRITHDRLEWAPDREQLTLTGIDFPYSPGTVRVQTPELEQIRTGLHSAGGDSELRLVFDFSVGDAAIIDLRELGDRIQLLVRRPGR